MLSFKTSEKHFIYPLTKTLSVKSPREFNNSELDILKHDVNTGNWQAGQKVIYNHFTETILITREVSHG